MTQKHQMLIILIASAIQAAPPEPLVLLPFDPAASPATSVPAARWGVLEPVHRPGAPDAGILGDSTDFSFVDEPNDEPFYHDVVTVAGDGGAFLFTTTGRGLETWDVTNPRQPVRRSYRHGPDTMPFTGPSDDNFPIRWLHTTRHDRLAVAAIGYGGLTIWDTSNKGAPFVIYQDLSIHANAVWTFGTGGRDFAWASQANGSGGARLYDLEGFPVSSYGDGRKIQWLHGYQQADEIFVAMVWLEGDSRIEIFDHHDAPLPPDVRLVDTFPEQVRQVALFPRGDQWFLAALAHRRLLIYDVTCIRTACSSLPPVFRTIETPLDPGNIHNHELSLVETSAGRFLYTGINAEGFTCVDRKQYLIDIETFRDVLHRDDYFLWYHHACSSGFNWVMSRRAAAHPSEPVIYRAAYSLLDSHRVIPATLLFGDGFETGDVSAWDVSRP